MPNAQELAHARSRFSNFIRNLAAISLASGALDPTVRGALASLLARDAAGGVPGGQAAPDGLPEGSSLHRRSAHVRALREDAREVDYVASTEAVDSYGEVVRQKWRLNRYNANPVILFAHDSHSLPIGQSVKTVVENKELLITVRYATAKANPFAEFVWQSVLERTLRAGSVGFFPHKVSREEIEGVSRIVLDDNELYEFSITPVPANPEALDRIDEKMLSLETLERFGDTLLKSLDLDAAARTALTKAFRDATLIGGRSSAAGGNTPAPGGKPANVPEVRGSDVYCQPGSVPFMPCDVITEAWDQGKALSALRGWASSDGSGDAAKIDFAKFAQGFALVKGPANEVKSYMFPHHTVRDGKLVAVRAAVYNAAARLREAKDLSDAERAAAEQHLGAEYRQMGAKAPWDTATKGGATSARKKEGVMPTSDQTINHPHQITLSEEDAAKLKARGYVILNCKSCGDGHHIDLAKFTDDASKDAKAAASAIEAKNAAEAAKTTAVAERDAAVATAKAAEEKAAKAETEKATALKSLAEERVLRVKMELQPFVGTGLHQLSPADVDDLAELSITDHARYTKLRASAENRFKLGGGNSNKGTGADANANKSGVNPTLPTHTPDPTPRATSADIAAEQRGAEDDVDLNAELAKRSGAILKSAAAAVDA